MSGSPATISGGCRSHTKGHISDACMAELSVWLSIYLSFCSRPSAPLPPRQRCRGSIPPLHPSQRAREHPGASRIGGAVQWVCGCLPFRRGCSGRGCCGHTPESEAVPQCRLRPGRGSMANHSHQASSSIHGITTTNHTMATRRVEALPFVGPDKLAGSL